jgi:hypothetical protein
MHCYTPWGWIFCIRNMSEKWQRSVLCFNRHFNCIFKWKHYGVLAKTLWCFSEWCVKTRTVCIDFIMNKCASRSVSVTKIIMLMVLCVVFTQFIWNYVRLFSATCDECHHDSDSGASLSDMKVRSCAEEDLGLTVESHQGWLVGTLQVTQSLTLRTSFTIINMYCEWAPVYSVDGANEDGNPGVGKVLAEFLYVCVCVCVKIFGNYFSPICLSISSLFNDKFPSFRSFKAYSDM